jgi:trans-aconitate 2-methyltransferase
MWNPNQYLKFSSERDRPFFDLLARANLESAKHIADLGCGTGHLTATLLNKFPDSYVVGVDSSAQMLQNAASFANSRLEFERADIATWQPKTKPDAIVSNAALQWLEGHETLIPRLAAMLNPGGILAVQMPVNFQQPSHTILRDLVSSEHWKPQLANDSSQLRAPESAAWYVETLSNLGFAVDAWETTYQHILQGENPVLEWVKGTALRPVLKALEPPLRATFLEELGARYRQAYPQKSFGTLFEFNRLFFVAKKIEINAIQG